MSRTARRPHCTPGSPTRLEKARKVEVLIGRRVPLAGCALLEVGTGTGVMATAFAAAVGPAGRVVAVDAHDQREVAEGYEFLRVTDARLPFPEGSFDVVVSNHVMEHVGTSADQEQHLREAWRVLVPDGLLYLAVPNRHRFVEPHFRLPFLSWLPQSWADRYVRLTRRGDWYDVDAPTRRRATHLLESAGFLWEECTVEAAQVMAEVEPSVARISRVVARAPRWLLRLSLPVVPTMVFVARKPA